MARILLIGGHGKVALLLAPLLQASGHHVTAVIRSEDQVDDVAATGATPLVIDISRLNLEQTTNVIAGNDVVIWSAGAGGGDAARTFAIDRDAAIRSIDAAAAAGVTRYIMVSYFGADTDHGVDPADPFFAYAEAKAAADTHVRASSLEWTIVAPSALTLDEPTGLISTTSDGSASVPRGDVAAVIAASIEESATVGRTIRFTAGETPIAAALHEGHA